MYSQLERGVAAGHWSHLPLLQGDVWHSVPGCRGDSSLCLEEVNKQLAGHYSGACDSFLLSVSSKREIFLGGTASCRYQA